MRIAILYDSKFGNTKQLAEFLANRGMSLRILQEFNKPFAELDNLKYF